MKLNENMISMVFGALVVLVVGVFLFNTLRNRAGSPEVSPQITPESAQTQNLQPQAGGTYKVQKGDTLWSIAERSYGSGYNWTDIATENKLANPGAIEEGQELFLPTQELAQAPTSVPFQVSPSPTPTTLSQNPQPTTPPTIQTESYMVVRGDHLWGIAVRAYGDGYQWVKIWRANKAIIKNHPNLIYVGQTLTIPRENTK
ncbi:MAG: LysM peptidoglycan-binding domain-containing protein [Patescibacteria group bacterium]